MKKKWEVRYLVTAVASIPVYKAYGKTETYRQAAKDGWGTVYRDENNALVCDEDCSASLYTKNGDYFGIFPYEEINTKEMPKQAECAAIIASDSCGFTVWAEDFSRIHIFVTRDENGLIDTYRVEYDDTQAYDGEVEISFSSTLTSCLFGITILPLRRQCFCLFTVSHRGSISSLSALGGLSFRLPVYSQ